LEKNEPYWLQSSEPIDREFIEKPNAVRRVLKGWSTNKIQRIHEEDSLDTLRSHIMFKQLHYGDNQSMNFGSIGTNWKKKNEIADELALYRPWSVSHAINIYRTRKKLFNSMERLVGKSQSPTEERFFDAWWNLTRDDDRPMLFPQVHGHTSGKFWQEISKNNVIPLHFDFGIVNALSREKIIVEIDSRRYHSNDQRYQADRDRQNIAELEGWSVRRFTYEDVMQRIEYCFENLGKTLKYQV